MVDLAMIFVKISICSFLVPVIGYARQQQLRATRLSAVAPQLPQLRLATDTNASAINASAHSSSPIEIQGKHGDITCIRWTGGTCWGNLFECKAERGTTTCEEGRCKCGRDICSSAAGACGAPKGEWKGSYSIMFKKQQPAHAYLTAAPIPFQFAHYIAITTDDGAPLWKLALMENKHVRLESLKYPGHYLSIGRGPKKWLTPKLKRLEEVDPAQSTFVVQETGINGGGLQIWNPGSQVAIQPHAGSQMVTTCDSRADNDLSLVKCSGWDHVEFTPPLPRDIVSPAGAREPVSTISPHNLWNLGWTILAGFCIILIWLLCYMTVEPQKS